MTDDASRLPRFVRAGEDWFCRFWSLRWRARLGDRVEFVRADEAPDRAPEDRERRARPGARLVEADGTVREGAGAVLRLLSLGGRMGALGWWLYRRLPPFRRASEAARRLLARHRSLAERLTKLLWGGDPRPSTYRTTARVLALAMAAVYLVAFASLLVQVEGLMGSGGILPAAEYLDRVRRATGGGVAAWWRAPTLAWLTGGGGLGALCLAGVGASVLLALGVAPLASAAAAWLLYLSLQVVGRTFLAYQWDLLLVEAGLLLVLVVPLGLRPAGCRRRSPWFPAVWLFWWLLFRLILESGLVKLAGGDPVWRDLTALAHHYETQPIPNPVAWLAHQLPLWLHRLSTLGTFAVELAVPVLFLLPRRPRMLGGALVAGHQALILATGNYGFFNLLTIAIALSLFDDAFWRRLLFRAPGGRWLRVRPGGAGAPAPGRAVRALAGLRRAATAGFLVVAVGVGAGQVARSAGVQEVPGPVRAAWRALSPFRVLNSYGLFANMTTSRPELALEGRRDGGPWRELEFRWKPDDPEELPPQVAPHQPRLDWQMWFAALRAERTPATAPPRTRYPAWLPRFVERLLAGSPEVWGLLDGEGPFREPGGEARPPDAIRIVIYDYRFTSPEQRLRTGRWWARRRIGRYLPPVRRTDDGGLEVVADAGDPAARAPAPPAPRARPGADAPGLRPDARAGRGSRSAASPPPAARAMPEPPPPGPPSSASGG